MSLVNPKLNSTAQSFQHKNALTSISPPHVFPSAAHGVKNGQRTDRCLGVNGVKVAEWSICLHVGHVWLYACISCHKAPAPPGPASATQSLQLMPLRSLRDKNGKNECLHVCPSFLTIGGVVGDFVTCIVACLNLLQRRGNGLLEGNLFIKIMC